MGINKIGGLMQLRDYGQKMADIEHLDKEELDWHYDDKKDSEYARFFEKDDMIPIKERSLLKDLVMVLNALLYVGIFVYFFGVKSLLAYIPALIPLTLILISVYGFSYRIRKKSIK
jgi:hypothetical protein